MTTISAENSTLVESEEKSMSKTQRGLIYVDLRDKDGESNHDHASGSQAEDYQEEPSGHVDSESHQEGEEGERMEIDEASDDAQTFFESKDEDKDLEITLDSGTKYYASLAILNLWTGYFRDHSTSMDKDPNTRMITVRGVSDKAMRTFLVKVYPPCDLLISEYNIRDLVAVADLVDCGQLLDACNDTLKSLPETLDLAVFVDKFKNRFEELHPKMVDWMAAHFTEIQHDAVFKELSKDTILNVVAQSNDNGSMPEEPPAKKARFWGWFGF